MNRILDQERFRWTPSWQTDVMATFKKHGFKRTTAKERAQRSEPNASEKQCSLLGCPQGIGVVSAVELG